MAVFMITMINGPTWDSSRDRREQDAWDAHAAFMDELLDGGFVVLGGPVGDGERVMLVAEAESQREVEDVLHDDPWESMGVLKIGSIEPWTIWLDSRQRAATR